MMANRSITQFEMRKKLQEALMSGRYFITITYLDEEGKRLQHYYSWENFPLDDVVPSLSHLASQIDKEKYDEKNNN